ncbi:cytochrome P450 [Fomitopsis serialis]|uniref:cytochrome P450 n=1 Tax=Fomitopsis serialis TaxID=139415 RepID=UPI0020088A3B|nr:cytochrome P450 [Neoantrodia serialis]KAH9925314.1 cytochrome P450 [Neoantrodia serialis]
MSASIVVLLVSAVVYLISRVASRNRHLPPGPSGLPIIGNALQMPTKNEWVIFADLAKKHGDIMHLSALGKSIILLTSRQAISDLLEKRGHIYSDRPIMPMASEMIGYSRFTVLCPYGTILKESRKLIGGTINARNAPQLQRVIETKIPQLLSRLLASPSDFRPHLRWLVASIVLQITHGRDINDSSDPLVQLAELVNAQFSATATPGKFLVDVFPFLRHVPDWLPGTGFKALAKEARHTLERILDEPYHEVKEQLARGTAVPSFTSDIIEKNPNPSPEELFINKMASTQFYLAGADTTVSALESMFLVLALYPEVQRKAQAEVDASLGSHQLPKFSDNDSLPYVTALVKEIHRWKPVAPLALPHMAMQDDTYDGYHIPKGATIIANSWAILHDSSIYPDPFEVKPERYLDRKREDINPDPETWSFGYGRRVCPGQILANDTVFLVTATILATFNITNARTLDGHAIDKNVDYEGGIITHAPPFTCTITPRSADMEQFIAAILGTHDQS